MDKKPPRTDPDSPTFPGNIFYVHVGTNATEPQYWLFYKPVADYLMTTQVLRQRTCLDKVSILGLYNQHLGVFNQETKKLPPLKSAF